MAVTESESSDLTRDGSPPPRARGVLFACLIGIFSTTFPATILTIAVRPIAVDLGSQPTTIIWVTTAPMLATAVSTPLLGRLGDLRGHRRLYLAGLAVAAVFSILTAFAWSASALIAFRTISQVGAAATIPSTFAMLFRTFPPSQRVRASSLASATLAGAAVVGVVIGGPAIDLVGWRLIFLVQAGIALVALVFSLLVLPRDRADRERVPIDYLGAAVLALATASLTFGINRLGVWGLSPVPLISLGVTPFAIWALVHIERRAEAPLLPLHVLSARNTRAIGASSFLVSASWTGNFIITPLFMQGVLGLGASVTSLLTVPRATFIMASAPAAARIGVRFGERRMVVVACAALSVLTFGMALGTAATSLVWLAISLPLTGWVFGHVQPGLVSAMGHSVDEDDFGVATSLQQTASQIGSVVGLGLFTSFAANSTTPGPFVVVYLLTSVFALGAAGFAAWMRTDRPLAPHIAPPVDDGQEGPAPPPT